MNRLSFVQPDDEQEDAIEETIEDETEKGD
jgi:hypothetical protein